MRNFFLALPFALALAPAVAAQNQGTVTGITATPTGLQGGFRITIQGSNPCTAVHMDWGDGDGYTWQVPGLPDKDTVFHYYTRAGEFLIRATGSGNCRGEASTRVRVILPTPPQTPAPAPATPPPPAPASAIRFADMDRNGDRVITRGEWRGSVSSFRFHDWNNDGILSGEEVQFGAAPPSRSGRFGSNAVGWTEADFRALDRNRDGGVTREEWRYDAADFYRLDRDRNNVLSWEEFRIGPVDDDRGDRFEDLDMNGDNRVDRNEWHGSDDVFRWLDRNGNGSLSRGEFMGDEAMPGRGRGRVFEPEPAPAPSERTLDVSARQAWTDTGIDVREGDMLRINATGTIQWAADRGAVSPPAGGNGAATPAAPLPGRGIGALVARIGDGAPFMVETGRGLIGSRGVIRAQQTGRLFLGVNDDVLTDNSGAFRVTVSVRR